MNKEININIYRDGEYSVKDNLKYKAKNFAQYRLPVIASKIDDFFTQH